MTTGSKVAEMRMNLKNIPSIDMIHLHRETYDIIYTKLFKATLQVSKLQLSKKRVEDLLRKENMEKKSHHTHIKTLQVELLVADNQADKGAAAQKLLNEKVNAIKLLKKKLKIPSTHLIHTFELTKLEKEK